MCWYAIIRLNQLRSLVNYKMKQLLIIFAASLLSVAACAHEETPQQDHISVMGVGEVQQEPDQAILSVGINAKRPSLAEAKKVADDHYRQVLEVIEKSGIDKKFVRSTQINAQPEYEWITSGRVYKGERVSRSLSITINQLDKVSRLLQDLVEADVSTIDGMTTGFQDPKAVQEKALAAAAADAQSKAKFLAERLDRQLGDAYQILERNTNAAQMSRPEAAMMNRASLASGSAPPPEMFGTQKMRATVNVSFNLL